MQRSDGVPDGTSSLTLQARISWSYPSTHVYRDIKTHIRQYGKSPLNHECTMQLHLIPCDGTGKTACNVLYACYCVCRVCVYLCFCMFVVVSCMYILGCVWIVCIFVCVLAPEIGPRQRFLANYWAYITPTRRFNFKYPWSAVGDLTPLPLGMFHLARRHPCFLISIAEDPLLSSPKKLACLICYYSGILFSKQPRDTCYLTYPFGVCIKKNIIFGIRHTHTKHM